MKAKDHLGTPEQKRVPWLGKVEDRRDPAGFEDPPDFLDGGPKLGGITQSVAPRHDIGNLVREWESAQVSSFEPDVSVTIASSSDVKHRCRDVQRDDGTAGIPLGEEECDIPSPTGEIHAIW